jgi:hypothetical protein
VTIERETSYAIGEDRSLSERIVNLIDFDLIEEKDSPKRDRDLVLFVSPFHLHNLIVPQYTYLDIKFLLQLRSPIASRLYDYIKTRKYIVGEKYRSKEMLVLDYEAELCKQLHIEPAKSKTAITRQLNQGMNELKEKNFIFTWEPKKNERGFWDIEIGIRAQYFLSIYNSLDPAVRETADKRYHLYSETMEKDSVDEIFKTWAAVVERNWTNLEKNLSNDKNPGIISDREKTDDQRSIC